MLRRRLLETIFLIALWMLLVFRLDPQNAVAATIAALLTVWGVSAAYSCLQDRFVFPRGWAAALAKLPLKMVTDTGRVLAALFRQIAKRERAVGELVRIPFDYEQNQPVDHARLAVSIFGIAITPNTVAITTSDDGILVHQLAHSSENAEERDPKWPV